MAFAVCAGALCACSFGTVPSALVITPENRVMCQGVPIATMMDSVPLKHIMPFGMCTSMANPQVAAATAAALGLLTPMPCMPVIPAPWVPGAVTVLIGNKPALNQSCVLACAWAGMIQITNPGTANVQIL